MQRRGLVLYFSICAVLISAPARGQSLDWVRQAGGSGVDSAEATGVDANGNTFVIGTFNTQITLGAGQTNETTLTSAGAIASQDIVVAKYDAVGDLQWARGIGGTDPSSGGFAGADLGEGIAIDSVGNAYVTGSLFSATTLADFGNGVMLGVPGVFVAKYDTDGNALWATALNNSGVGWAIAVDGVGNSYVAGSAADPVLGGSIPTVWKLSGSGAVLWQRQAPGDGGVGLAISVDGNGDSLVAGRFAGTATFGPAEPSQTVLNAGNSTAEGFVAKYDGLGDLVWASQSSSDTGSWMEGVGVDTNGNSYVTGTLNGTTTFGGGESNETTLVAYNVGDMFLAKYDSAGQLVWVQQGPGSFNASGMAISIDPQGASHVTGYFGNTITFGSGQPNETTLLGLGGGDVFVAKFDTDGGLEWARQAGGSGGPFGDSGNGIAVDRAGDARVVGFFQSSATFGSAEPRETTLTSVGQTDLFVARYMNDAVQPTALDLDIAQFRVTKHVALSRGSIDLTLVVRNSGVVNGQAQATVVGVQNGVQVYAETITVSDPVGSGRSKFDFPAFAPTAAGDITWTATIDDPDPDIDISTAVTRVVN
jgi:Beta-propeller repeat